MVPGESPDNFDDVGQRAKTGNGRALPFQTAKNRVGMTITEGGHQEAALQIDHVCRRFAHFTRTLPERGDSTTPHC